MSCAVSLDGGETRARQNERFEALKERYPPTPNDQQDLRGNLYKVMDRDLYRATKEGDVDKFIDALEKVFESRKLTLSLIFDQVTPSGNSLLHLTGSFGNLDVMEFILLHDPNTATLKNSLEDTPLHVAVQDQRVDAIKKLIHLGTYPEIVYWKNKDGKSPLYLAVEKCNRSHSKDRKEMEREIFLFLLQESARDEAYAVKIQGMSPIFAGIHKWHTDLLKEIIDRLPKLLHVRDEDGGTPMHAAASVGNYNAIDLLLKKCPYLALEKDNNGSYPIHIASEAGEYFAIKRLLKDTWPDLAEIKNKKGQNILHVAAKAGNDSAVDYLLKKYSKHDTIEKLVNAKDVDGNTPLHLASMHNHCHVMRSLTKVKRIRLELRNNDGLTALDVAMESENLSTKYSAFQGRAILIAADVPQSKGRDALSPKEHVDRAWKSSSTKWIKDQVNTLLVVATLVASVTFTAGLTLPGGYNAPSDPHPGTATMLHHRMFRVFVIANVLAMYSSILAVVVLLWGLNTDFSVAELAYHSAGPLLLMALTSMSVAFLAAVTVAVSKLSWLGILVLYLGVFCGAMVVVVLAAFIFASSSKYTMMIMVYYYIMVSKIGKCVKFCVLVLGSIIVCVPVLVVGLCFLPVEWVQERRKKGKKKTGSADV